MNDDQLDEYQTIIRCPYCKRVATVRIKRFATKSPQHVDLECRCDRCGETWQAAECMSATGCA